MDPRCFTGAHASRRTHDQECVPSLTLTIRTRVLERRRYSTLGRLVAGEGAMVAVKKLAADQLLFAPPFLAVILSLCVIIMMWLCHLHPAPLA